MRGQPDPVALHEATLQQLSQQGSATPTSARTTTTRSESREEPAPAADPTRARPVAPSGGGFFATLIGVIWFCAVWTLILAGKLLVGGVRIALWVMDQVTSGSHRYDQYGRRVQ